jgi:hypothetical protein
MFVLIKAGNKLRPVQLPYVMAPRAAVRPVGSVIVHPRSVAKSKYQISSLYCIVSLIELLAVDVACECRTIYSKRSIAVAPGIP